MAAPFPRNYFKFISKIPTTVLYRHCSFPLPHTLVPAGAACMSVRPLLNLDSKPIGAWTVGDTPCTRIYGLTLGIVHNKCLYNCRLYPLQQGLLGIPDLDFLLLSAILIPTGSCYLAPFPLFC
uniref:Uncharacterized protein n=1 Tax=Xenopus tropicalis TaxID=8364 RepID=A0A803JG78_XENTR